MWCGRRMKFFFRWRCAPHEVPKMILPRSPFPYRFGISDLGVGQASDAGWGCMIRVQQMAVAEALSRLDLFRVDLFCDEESAPLGIHAFCRRYENLYKKPTGTWLGPTSSATVAAALLNEGSEQHFGGKVRGVVFEDGPIYEDELLDVLPLAPSATPTVAEGARGRIGSDGSAASSNPFPAVVWVCRKLGVVQTDAGEGRRTTEELQYRGAIEALFRLDSFVAIGSGNEGASAYCFLGCTEGFLLHLDPHRAVLPALTSTSDGGTASEYVSERPELVRTCVGKLSWTKLNQSLNFCFLLRSEEHWREVKTQLEKIPEGLDLIEIMAQRPTMPTDADLDDLALDDDDF